MEWLVLGIGALGIWAIIGVTRSLSRGPSRGTEESATTSSAAGIAGAGIVGAGIATTGVASDEIDGMNEGDYHSGPAGYSPMTAYPETQYGSGFDESADWHEEQ
jgi:hypothetical protein